MAQASSLYIKAGGVPDYIRGSNRKLQDFILFQKVKQSTRILKYLTALLGAKKNFGSRKLAFDLTHQNGYSSRKLNKS